MMFTNNKRYQLLFLLSLLVLLGPTLAKKTKQRKKRKSNKQCKRPNKAKTPKECKGAATTYGADLPTKDIGSLADVQTCSYAFQASGFRFFDSPKYDLWLDEDSILNLASTGLYKGVSNIEEYVNFANAKDLFDFYAPTKSGADVGGGFPPFLPIVANGSDCVLTFAVVNSMVTNATTATPNTGAVSLDTTVGLRIQFSILEPTATSIYVDRIELVSL